MRLSAGSLTALCLAFAGMASAQTYPEKQVTVVIPFPPGGAVDPVARTVTQHMSEQWSQPIVLLNRAGAGGNIGAETVARAVPDGYTPDEFSQILREETVKWGKVIQAAGGKLE